MLPVRFIHAADLHLDAATRGLSRDLPPALAERLHDATFTALERLVCLCLDEKPDFLIVAGDLYNHEDGSLRAQLKMRDGCERLAAAGVRVFITHGNHDPLSSRIHSLRWPDNTTIFDDSYAAHPVTRNGETIAIVHGISHATARETRNLSRLFNRTEDACPQIGILHCTLGTADGEQRYAPCSLEDLTGSGMDYWALGHIHQRQVVCETPRVVYPGSTQGLHIGEEGQHGCILVDMDASGRMDLAFRPLGPVQWQTVNIDIGSSTGQRPEGPATQSTEATAGSTAHDPASEHLPPADVDALTALAVARMEEATAAAHAGCTDMIFRLDFTGRGPLDRILRRTADAADLLEHLRSEVAALAPGCWIKDFRIDTRPDADMDALLGRDDLLGATLREAAGTTASPEALHSLAAGALASLYTHHAARKALDQLDDATLAALAADAARLCIDLLESD